MKRLHIKISLQWTMGLGTIVILIVLFEINASNHSYYTDEHLELIADTTFKAAIDKDMEAKSSVLNVFYKSNRVPYKKHQHQETHNAEFVTLEDTISCSLDSMLCNLNISLYPDIRTGHSIVYTGEKSLQADSLNAIWQQLLLQSGVHNRCALRFVNRFTTDTVLTSQSDWTYDAEPVFTRYIGYCSEWQVEGYLDGQSGIANFLMHSPSSPVRYCLIVLCLGWIGYGGYTVLRKRNVVESDSTVEIQTYQFVKERNVIQTPEGAEVKFQPLLFSLLLLIHERELKYDDLENELWGQLFDNDNNNHNRLYAAISKLKREIVAHGLPFEIVRLEQAYKLVVTRKDISITIL